jgi:flavin reductase (DIM6/NTAB) family NADH-FMN oxidoreductase RutF
VKSLPLPCPCMWSGASEPHVPYRGLMAPEPRSLTPHRFREVLGHFPTGVAIITALDRDGGPVGLTVGSFTSVSLEPPLIAYLPAKTSSRFPRIRAAESFCVNILAADQEQLCRQFARSGADPFADPDNPVGWTPAPSGAPLLDGVVGWVDCAPQSVQEAGDHWLVMGRVLDLGVENPTIPLLFFQGGYGAFAPRALVASPREQLEDQVRMADLVRHDLSDLADEMHVETRAVAVAENEQVLVAAARPSDSRSFPIPVGTRLPLIPPWNAAYLAWEPADEVEQRCSLVNPSLTEERRAEFDRELARIGRHGWALSYREDQDRLDELSRLLEAQQRFGHTPAIKRGLAEVVSRMRPHGDTDSLDDAIARTGLSVSVPVFDAGCHVPMLLVAFDLPAETTAAGVRLCRDRLLDAAARATELIGGVPPAAYAVRR